MREYVIESDKLSVKLGETKEEVIDKLQKAKLRFVTPFEGLADNSVIKETVINVPDCGIELMFENDIVSYIKSHNNTYNIICDTDIGEKMSVQDMQHMLAALAKKFNVDTRDITIRHMNLRRADAVLIINDEKIRVKVHLLCNLSGKVFISTLKVIPKQV